MSSTETTTLHVVYTSEVAEGHERTAFAQICRVARQRNAGAGIGGVLLFDGQRFCQWLQGPAAAVSALIATILADARHERVRVWLEADAPPRPEGTIWRAGFVDPDALPTFTRACAVPGAEVLAAVEALLPGADLWPGADA